MRGQLLGAFIMLGALGIALAQGRTCDAKRHTCTAHCFLVHLRLSPKADALLIQRKETVVVAAYVTGTPRKGTPKKLIDCCSGDISIGEARTEVQPGEDAEVPDFTLDSNAMNWVNEDGPQLLVNVFSGRRSSKNNLLSCTIYEGPLSKIENGSTAISCRLISEEYPDVPVRQ